MEYDEAPSIENYYWPSKAAVASASPSPRPSSPNILYDNKPEECEVEEQVIERWVDEKLKKDGHASNGVNTENDSEADKEIKMVVIDFIREDFFAGKPKPLLKLDYFWSKVSERLSHKGRKDEFKNSNFRSLLSSSIEFLNRKRKYWTISNATWRTGVVFSRADSAKIKTEIEAEQEKQNPHDPRVLSRRRRRQLKEDKVNRQLIQHLRQKTPRLAIESSHVGKRKLTQIPASSSGLEGLELMTQHTPRAKLHRQIMCDPGSEELRVFMTQALQRSPLPPTCNNQLEELHERLVAEFNRSIAMKSSGGEDQVDAHSTPCQGVKANASLAPLAHLEWESDVVLNYSLELEVAIQDLGWWAALTPSEFWSVAGAYIEREGQIS